MEKAKIRTLSSQFWALSMWIVLTIFACNANSCKRESATLRKISCRRAFFGMCPGAGEGLPRRAKRLRGNHYSDYERTLSSRTCTAIFVQIAIRRGAVVSQEVTQPREVSPPNGVQFEKLIHLALPVRLIHMHMENGERGGLELACTYD